MKTPSTLSDHEVGLQVVLKVVKAVISNSTPWSDEYSAQIVPRDHFNRLVKVYEMWSINLKD